MRIRFASQGELNPGRIEPYNFIAKSSLGTWSCDHLQKPTCLGLWRCVESEVCKDCATWPGNVRCLSHQSWSVIIWVTIGVVLSAIESEIPAYSEWSPGERRPLRAACQCLPVCARSGCVGKGGDSSGGDSSGGSGNGCCSGEGGWCGWTANSKSKE